MPDVRFGIDASGAQRGYAELSRIFAGITQGAQQAADAIKAVESARTGGAGGKVSADRQKQIEAETKAIQTETKAIIENTKVQADAIATANRVFATKKEELNLRASLYKALQSEEKATVAAARATLTALSTLGGANRALAQRVQWEDRMRKALEAGVITETQLIKLRQQAEIQFSTQAVKARDLRTNIAGLSKGFQQLASLLAIHNPAMSAAVLATNRLAAATRNLAGGFALLGPLVSILGTAAIAFGALAVAGDRTNRIPAALKRIWEGMKEIAARASEAVGATNLFASALEALAGALPVVQTLEQRLAGVREELEAIQKATPKTPIAVGRGAVEFGINPQEEADRKKREALQKEIAALEKQIADRNATIDQRLQASIAREKIMHDLRKAEEERLKGIAAAEKSREDATKAGEAATKQAEQRTLAYADALAKLREEEAQATRSQQERLKDLEVSNELLVKEIEATRQGTEALRKFNEEKAVTLELERQRESGAVLSQQESQALEDQVRRQVQLNEELRRTQDEVQQVAKANVQAAQEAQKVWDNAIENIQKAWGDLFSDLFRDPKHAFDNFGDFIKDWAAETAGQLVTAFTITPALEGLEQIFGAITRGTVQNLFGGTGAAKAFQPIVDPVKDLNRSIQHLDNTIQTGGVTGGAGFTAPSDLAAVLDQFRFEEMLSSGIGDGLDPLKDALDQFRFEEIVLGASPELKGAVSQGVVTGLKQAGGGFRFTLAQGGPPSGFGVFAPTAGGGLGPGIGGGVGGPGGPAPTGMSWNSAITKVGSSLAQGLATSLSTSAFGQTVGLAIGNTITGAFGGQITSTGVSALGMTLGQGFGMAASPLSAIGGVVGTIIGQKLGFQGLPGVAGFATSAVLTGGGAWAGGALGAAAGPSLAAAFGPAFGAAAGPVGIILGAIIGAIVAQIAGGRAGLKARIGVMTAPTAELLRQQGLEGGIDITRQTPFGFIGVSGAGTTSNMQESITQVLNLIKNVDKVLAKNLTRAEVELVKLAGLPLISANEKRTFEKLTGQRIATIFQTLAIPPETIQTLALTTGGIEEQIGKAVEFLGERKQIIDFLDKLRGTFEDVTEAEKAFEEIELMAFAVRESAKFFGLIVEDVETLEQLAKTRVIEGFNQQITDAILQFTNAGILAWDTLLETQANRVREATKLGADLVKVERLGLLERQALLRQINDPIQSVIDQIKTQALGQAPSQALAAATTRFADVAEALRASTGEFNTQDLANAAQTLLQVSQELLGAPAFTAIRDTILTTLQEFIMPMSAADAAALEALHQIQENTATQDEASAATLQALTVETLGISQQVSDALANVGLGSTAMQTLSTETNTHLGSIHLEIARGNSANEQLLQLVLTENAAMHSELVLLRANLERLLAS